MSSASTISSTSTRINEAGCWSPPKHPRRSAPVANTAWSSSRTARWPGNALTEADVTWQLEQMAAQGIGGVEIMSLWKVYEKGNVEYLTPEFLDLVKHTVAEAKRLDIEVAVTFSPGWGFGGAWVPQEDQSKVLCLASKDLEGGARFCGGCPPAIVPASSTRCATATGSRRAPSRVIGRRPAANN